MAITVKFFASLREITGMNEYLINNTDSMTLLQTWEQATTKPMPSNTLAALNMAYSDLSATAKDGDEVAFFPPVTGG